MTTGRDSSSSIYARVRSMHLSRSARPRGLGTPFDRSAAAPSSFRWRDAHDPPLAAAAARTQAHTPTPVSLYFNICPYVNVSLYFYFCPSTRSTAHRHSASPSSPPSRSTRQRHKAARAAHIAYNASVRIDKLRVCAVLCFVAG